MEIFQNSKMGVKYLHIDYRRYWVSPGHLPLTPNHVARPFGCGQSFTPRGEPPFSWAIPSSISISIYSGWWYTCPSEKYESQWEGLSHILWKMKNNANHQQVFIDVSTHSGTPEGLVYFMDPKISWVLGNLRYPHFRKPPYLIISYKIISIHTKSYNIVSYQNISYHIKSYHIKSNHTKSNHIKSIQTISSYQIISYQNKSNHIISKRNKSYHIISTHISYQIISYQIKSYHIISSWLVIYLPYHFPFDILLNHHSFMI